MYVLSESMLGGLFIPKNRTSNQNLKSKLLDRRITFIKLKKKNSTFEDSKETESR